MSDEKFAKILIAALRIQTRHVGSADSIRQARMDLFRELEVTEEALRRYIEKRAADPRVWVRLVEVLEREFKQDYRGQKYAPPR